MSEARAENRSEPGVGSTDGDSESDVLASGSYRFPPRNPNTGAVIGLLRPQFGVGGR